jgi:hypothetical protein
MVSALWKGLWQCFSLPLVPLPLPLACAFLPPPPPPPNIADLRSMDTPAAATTTALPLTSSALKEGDVVWVSMGSKPGTSGKNGVAFWASVLHFIPATNEVRVQRHDTKRKRNVPAGACKAQEDQHRESKAIADGVPDPNSRPSWKRLGKKGKDRLEKVAASKVENELRRLHIEVDKLRAANSKSTDAAANEMALALKHLGRKKGTPPPPFSLSLLPVHYILCVCVCVYIYVYMCDPPHFLSYT